MAKHNSIRLTRRQKKALKRAKQERRARATPFKDKWSDAFLASPEWRALRLTVIAKYGPECMRCRYTPPKKIHVHVDHIKPRRHFPELALSFDNLQILCARCNKDKGNKHYTDYRPNPDVAVLHLTQNEIDAMQVLREMLR